MSWTDERVALLKKLWAEGLSASQITGRLGGVSRSAVIGKVHRLGLSGRATTSRMKSHLPKKKAAERKPRTAARVPLPNRIQEVFTEEPYTPQQEEITVPENERFSILRRNESGNVECDPRFNDESCRWPIGDPRHEDFHFCNRKKVSGLPYCERHARVAFQPPQARRKQIEQSEAETAKAGAEFKRKREMVNG